MIGKILKTIRLSKGFKQSELAKQLNISQTTLSGYETSYSNPRFEVIEKFAEKCGYEVVFRNKKDKTEITSKSIKRLDI
ncbi:MAG: helix-turn-helix transcriptional regulator [Bacilli bacterium]|nr:helix-turn-helix transcriptional regulator [Bacilli bacterium]